jgi:hypothetical protein
VPPCIDDQLAVASLTNRPWTRRFPLVVWKCAPLHLSCQHRRAPARTDHFFKSPTDCNVAVMIVCGSMLLLLPG